MRRWNFQGNILVSNLSETITPPELAGLFDDYGLVLGVQLKEVPSNAGVRLIGIIALAPDKAADEAIEGLQGRVVNGRKLRLKRSIQKEKTKRILPAGARPRRLPAGPPPDDFLPIPRSMRDGRPFYGTLATAAREDAAQDFEASPGAEPSYRAVKPAREPLVVKTRTPKKVIIEDKAGGGRSIRPMTARPKLGTD